MKRTNEMDLTYSGCLKKHFNDYGCKILITSHITWLPFEMLISELRCKILEKVATAQFFETTLTGLRECSNSELSNKRYKWTKLISVLSASVFYKSFFQLLIVYLKLYFKFEESKSLAQLCINHVKIGDIVAAEYLRSPAYGNGILKIDARFFLLLLKYLIVYINFNRSLESLLSIYQPEDIRYCLQETSFKDEMMRRILINKRVLFEYQFDKYIGKLVLFEYQHYSEGRVFEYTPKLYNITEAEIFDCNLSLNNRVNQGVAIWTGNVTDIDSSLQLDGEIDLLIDRKRPIAVLFLHAVADDQFRCGLDCFISIDDFHRFTIKNLLSLGYQCILKPHPGIKSDLHPDKTLIDNRYVTGLFQNYGLNYLSTIDSNGKLVHRSNKYNDIYSMNPRVSAASILDKINFIALTHHGNITYEALHLKIPVLKYRYCKSREFNFTHSWVDRVSYIELLEYYRDHRCLQPIEFPDNYLTVSAILSRKKKFIDYNKVFFTSYSDFYYDENVNMSPRNAHESRALLHTINNKISSDDEFALYLKKRMRALLA